MTQSDKRVGLLVAGLVLAGEVFARTLVVDNRHPLANDENEGTRDAPLRAISAAAQLAAPGDTVLVRPGVYREAVKLTVSGRADAPIVFRSEEPHAATISGSDVLDVWETVGPGVWAAEVPAVRPVPYRGGNPQWIYFGGYPLERAEQSSRLIPGTFFLDVEASKVYVAPPEGRVPSDVVVAYARREGLLHAVGPIDDIHVIGFTFEHNADWFRGIAALRVSGRRWLVENNQIRWSSYVGLSMRESTDAVVRGNLVEWCGCMGVGGGPNLRLLFEGNSVRYNNWRLFNWGNEGGGSKWVQTLDSIYRGNTVAYNFGPGLWQDGVCEANLFDGNECHDNSARALFTEINWHDIIQGNLVYNNGEGGITVSHSPGTVVRRNVIFNNGVGVSLAGLYARRGDPGGAMREHFLEKIAALPGIEPRRVTQWECNYLKYWVAPAALPLNNCLVWENLIFENRVGIMEGRDYRTPSSIDGFVNNLSNHNIFWAASDRDLFSVGWQNRYEGMEDWRACSGRDLDSRMADPRDPATELPEWAAARRAQWDLKMRPQSEIMALNLQLVQSPMAQAAIGRMLRSPLLRIVPLEDNRIKAVLLEVDGERTLALWTTQVAERRDLRLFLDQPRVTVESGYLGREERSLPRGAVDLMVSYNPIYLRGIGETVVEAPAGILRVPAFNLANQPIVATAIFAQEGRQPAALAARFTPGPGYKAEPASIQRTLQPGERWETIVTLTPDGTLRRGASHLRMEASIDEEPIRRMAVFTVGEGDRLLPRIAAPPSLDGALDDWGPIVSGQLPLAELGDASRRVFGAEEDWKGPADLSARVYGAWTPEALYLAVVVTDDRIVLAPADGDPARHDGVGIAFDGRAPDMQWQQDVTPGCYQAAISPVAGGSTVIRPVYAARNVTGVEAFSAKTTDGYTIELRIPLTARNVPAGEWEAGRPIRLSVQVQDVDERNAAGPKSILGWGVTLDSRGRLSDFTTQWEPIILAP